MEDNHEVLPNEAKQVIMEENALALFSKASSVTVGSDAGTRTYSSGRLKGSWQTEKRI